MRATKVYAEVTARDISARMIDWLNDLVERFGDDEVCAAISAEAARGEMKTLIGRVRDRLARQAVQTSRPTPRELSADELMGWVRGQWEPPGFPVIYDLGRLHLTHEEMLEVEAVGRSPWQPAPTSRPMQRWET